MALQVDVPRGCPLDKTKFVWLSPYSNKRAQVKMGVARGAKPGLLSWEQIVLGRNSHKEHSVEPGAEVNFEQTSSNRDGKHYKVTGVDCRRFQNKVAHFHSIRKCACSLVPSIEIQ